MARLVATQAFLLCLLVATPAAARELVILVQPTKASPALREAFNRLRGELSLHGFAVEVVTVEQSIGSEELGARADAEDAVASVSFATKADPGSDSDLRVEIWISDRVTGKTTSQTIVPQSVSEAPTVISVRALELLRASLREFAADEPAVEIEGAHPERAEEAVLEVRVPPPPKRTVTFGAGVAATWSLPSGSDAYGPEVSLGYIHGAFGVRAFGAGPFQGGRVQASVGHLNYQTVTLGAEPLFFPIRSPRWTLGFFPSAGASHLEVRGEVSSPYMGTEDRGWLFTAGGGAEAAVRLSRTIELYVRGRGFWLLPTPLVEIGAQTVELSSPSFSAGLGVRLSPG